MVRRNGGYGLTTGSDACGLNRQGRIRMSHTVRRRWWVLPWLLVVWVVLVSVALHVPGLCLSSGCSFFRAPQIQ